MIQIILNVKWQVIKWILFANNLNKSSEQGIHFKSKKIKTKIFGLKSNS
jgi:hypothetical protein